jgi:hypothetical protein
MKKTKQIQLVLMTALLASCDRPEPQWRAGGRTYIRSDSTAPYTVMQHSHPGYAFLFYAFRPYGIYTPFGYRRLGYYSNALSEEVNIGHSAVKSGIVRGGFGESALSVES